MEHVYVSFCDSALGLWRLEADESGLRSVTLASCVCDVEQNQITRQAKEELEEYTVWGHFWVCPNLIKGNWEVTFPVVEME